MIPCFWNLLLLGVLIFIIIIILFVFWFTSDTKRINKNIERGICSYWDIKWAHFVCIGRSVRKMSFMIRDVK